ncbi:hypothetical protein ACIRL2_33515 [Embleya sp. NPDC127516]
MSPRELRSLPSGRRVVYAVPHGHINRLVDEALRVADHRIGNLPPHD